MTRVAYTALLRVQVEIETEDGSGPPFYDPGYDFLAVRSVETVHLHRGEYYEQARGMIEVGMTDDFDPDGLLVSETISAGTTYGPGEVRPEDSYTQEFDGPTLEFK